MNNYAISVPFGLFTEANGHFGVVSSLDWINLFNGTWSCGAITPHDFQYTLIIIDFDYTIRQLSFTSSSTACNKYPWCNTIDQTMVGDAAKEVWRMSLVASPVWAIVLFCFIPPFFILNQTQWLLSRTPLSSLFTCNSPKLLSWSHWLLLLNLYIFQNKTIAHTGDATKVGMLPTIMPMFHMWARWISLIVSGRIMNSSYHARTNVSVMRDMIWDAYFFLQCVH